MREIKFRAWIMEENKMIFPIAVHQNDNTIQRYKVQEWEDIPDNLNGVMWYTFPDECILMQFTGLKDKFGKEIYEGDILEITNQTSELKGSKVSVVFKEGCFCDGYYGWRLSQHKEYNLEIIGNIYENPELLSPPLS